MSHVFMPCLLALSLLHALCACAEAADLPLGVPVSGQHKGEPTIGLVAGGGKEGWHSEFTVRLEAGQSIIASVEVTGKTRLVGLEVLDPSGKRITAGSVEKMELKSSELIVEEVPSSGRYRVIVVSNYAGPFKLTVKDLDASEDEVQSLENEVRELKEKLLEAEAKLKKAKEAAK